MSRAAPFRLDFEPGRVLSGKYRVEEKLGEGWEGEVYKITEIATGIVRVAKFYFPERNPRGVTAARYARKLEVLKRCPIVTQYHHQDWVRVRRRGQARRVEYLVSDYAEGRVLSRFLAEQRGGRLPAFEALHLLHALASGIEPIHRAGEYHGDIHSENVLVRRQGIGFEVKLLDFFDLGRPSRSRQQDDVADLAAALHQMIGGAGHYASQPALVKHICAGRRRSLVIRRVPSVAALLRVLATWEWEE